MLLHLVNKVKCLVMGAITRLLKSVPTILPTRHRTTMAQLPPNLLLFRTITTVLSGIPHVNDFVSRDTFTDKAWKKSEAREELKALDAFAQLLVTQYEVVSVVSNRSQALRLVTSTTAENTSEILIPGEDDQEYLEKFMEIMGAIGRAINWTYQIVSTFNDRRLDKTTSSQQPGPELVDPVAPSDLGDRDVMTYIEGLQMNW